MVRTLDTNLTNAVNSANRTPAITLTIEDRVQHFLAYQTSNNADQWIDACVANDNSIVRVTITRGGTGFNQTFKYQRITDPTQGSQWSTWSTFSSGSGNMFQDGGCAISNNGGTLRAFAQNGSNEALEVWTSTTNGASWTGPVTVLTPPGSALTRGIGSAGNNDVFFLYDVSGGEAIGVSFFTSSWSAIHTISPTPQPQAGYGIAAYWGTNIYYIFYSDTYSLYSGTYAPGTSTWTQGVVMAPATSTAVGRLSPRIQAIDGLFWLIFIEHDSGTFTGTTYNYPRVKQSNDGIHWSTGFILHQLTGFYGANILKTPPETGSAGTRYYAANGINVYSATAYSTSDATKYVDASATVLTYKRTERPNKPALLEVEIDNNKGVYNSLATVIGTTTFEPLGPDATLVLSEGYKVGGPPPNTADVVVVGRYRIQQVMFDRTPEENLVRIIGRDLSRDLDLMCRWQTTYTNQTVSWLVSEILARAGILLLGTLPVTTQMSEVIPSYILKAGQTYRKALDEVCQTYNLVYFLDQNEIMQVKEKSSSDGSIWTYKPEIESAGWVTDDERANHIIVSGKPPATGQSQALTEGEAYDDVSYSTVLKERVLHYVDTKLTTTAQCVLKAGFLLSEEQRAQFLHTAVVPCNPALQMYDGIQLNDYIAPTGSGQSGVFRIIMSEVVYQPEHMLFEHHLAVEGI